MTKAEFKQSLIDKNLAFGWHNDEFVVAIEPVNYLFESPETTIKRMEVYPND